MKLMNSRLTLKQKIGLNTFKLYRENLKKLHPLQCLYWEVTMDCNLNCLHCGSDCIKRNGKEDMPVSHFINMLSSVKKYYNTTDIFVGITGGEPLLRRDLEEAIKEIRTMGFPVGIVSNGLLLTKERFESLILSGLNSLAISFDGLEESHNWLRGRKDSYRAVLKAISLGGIYSQRSNFIFDVITCANPRNIDELEEMRSLLLKLKIKRWRILPIFPRGRAKDSQLLLLNSAQQKKLLGFIERYRDRDGLIISYGCEGYLGSYEGKVRDRFFYCQSGVTTASILNDGSITGCVSMRGDFIQGNIYSDNFIDIWEKGFINLRERSWTRNGICESCKEFKWCDGGALHLREGVGREALGCCYKNYTNITGD